MGRIVPEIDPVLSDQIEENIVNVKRIPSRRNLGLRRLPAQLEFAAQAKLKAIADKKFRQNANELYKVLYNFKLPDDSNSLEEKRKDIKISLELRDKLTKHTGYDPTEFHLKEECDIAQYELKKLIDGTLEDRRRDWHYYEYDEYSSALYMSVRLPSNYACIKTVMDEIRAADPSFEPSSVMDFGSGAGTTIWAVNETWPNSVSEFLNIDLSKEQQHLCEFLLRRGKHFGDHLPGIFHKQYLPTSTKSKFDMVVAAFSMLELPNSEMRAHVVENLWNKTNDLLVIIERGNFGGFSTINEARHLILDLGGRNVTSRLNKTYETKLKPDLIKPNAHVVAPCSHDFLCPKISMPCKKRMNECRFKVAFEPLEFGQQAKGYLHEEFSYVVLRRGPYSNNYYHDIGHKDYRWPRIVEPRNKGSGQLGFKLCTPEGNLAETIITKKYGKPIFQLAKSCDWGDILPIRIKDTYISKSSSFIDKKTLRNSSDKSNEQHMSVDVNNISTADHNSDNNSHTESNDNDNK